MNKDKIKKIVSLLGKSLGVLGLLFVFYKLSQEYTLDTFIEKLFTLLHIIPSLLILNFVSILVGIFVWHIMLLNYAANSFPYLLSYYYFAKTEISKYLPGNIFHFLGRQMLASSLGISQVEMAKISLLFSLFLLAGTIISSTLFAFLSINIPVFILALLALSSSIAFVGALYFYPSFPKQKKVYMILLSSVSVALQGVMLGIIVGSQIENFTAALFCQVASIYIISWLIGFITPGASGGLGVREGAFIVMASYLHLNIAPDIILFSVLLLRLVNIAIDIILYLSTFLLSAKIKKLLSPSA